MLAEPDPRNRNYQIADLHSFVRSIELSRAVPDIVREHFDVARNVFVYSWFVYEFATLAEQHAYGAVEMGLIVIIFNPQTDDMRWQWADFEHAVKSKSGFQIRFPDSQKLIGSSRKELEAGPPRCRRPLTPKASPRASGSAAPIEHDVKFHVDDAIAHQLTKSPSGQPSEFEEVLELYESKYTPRLRRTNDYIDWCSPNTGS